MRGTRLESWEVDIVLALDAAHIEGSGRIRLEKEPKTRMINGEEREISVRPLSPALFDALF